MGILPGPRALPRGIFALLFCGIAALPLPLRAQPAPANATPRPAEAEDEMVQLNFPEQMELNLLIQYVSDRLGIKILYDQEACCGGTSDGRLSREYYYMKLDQGSSPDINEVTRLIVEDTLDDNGTAVERTLYGLNDSGRLLRKAFIDDPKDMADGNHWCESWKYVLTSEIATYPAKANRIAEYRMPSAHDVSEGNVATFLDPYDDGAGGWANDSARLRDDDGLIYVYNYTVNGDQNGTFVKEGEAGTANYVSAADYEGGSDPKKMHLVTATYDFPTMTTDRADGKKTTYVNTFRTDGSVEKVTTTFPTIGSGQNGSGQGTSVDEYFDESGRLRWTKDGEGYVHYYSYHPQNGQLAFQMVDVDPSDNAKLNYGAAGKWLLWSGNAPFTRGSGLPAALELVTKHEFDAQARERLTIGHGTPQNPNGVKHYTLYEANKVLVFPYWDGDNPILPIKVTQFDGGGQLTDVYELDPATADDGEGAEPVGLDSYDQDDYVSWTKMKYDPVTGVLDQTRRYHSIPDPENGDGLPSTNYSLEVHRYDKKGRVEYEIRVASGTATSSSVEQVTQYVYDVQSRVVEIKRGVSPASGTGSDMGSGYDQYPTMTRVETIEYDGGSPAVGDGHVTQRKTFFGTGDNDHYGFSFYRTFRGHLRGIERFGASETPVGPYTVQDADWRGQVSAVAQFDDDSGFGTGWSTVVSDLDYAATEETDRRSLYKTSYDDLGRVFRTEEYAVAAGDGTAGDKRQVDFYYDRNSRRVAEAPKNDAATEWAYDGAGRMYQTRTVRELDPTSTYTSGKFNYRDPEPHPSLSSMTGGNQTVLELHHQAHDAMGNVTEEHTFEINHEDDHGITLSSTGDYVRRTVYNWYDSADRLASTADFGCGNGTGSGDGTWTYNGVPTRSSTAETSSSDVKLVRKWSYNSMSGRLETATDAEGKETKYFHDDLGRTTYVAEHYHDFDPSMSGTTGDSADTSKDRVTKFEYNGLDRISTLTAMDANGDGNSTDDQATKYLYEHSIDASLATNIIYPDSSDTSSSGTDQVKLDYNVDGTLKSRQDQRETEIEYSYTDGHRQRKLEAATAFGGSTYGSGEETDAVRSILYEYDDMDRLEKVTSYDGTSGSGNVLNQVRFEYNDLGQVTKAWQSHQSAVVTSGGSESPKVVYGYDLTASGGIYTQGTRVKEITYPSGRKLTYGFSGSNGFDDRLHRPNEMKTTVPGYSGSPSIVTYQHNGVGRLVAADYPLPEVKLDYFQGTSGTYAGLDRFGRVKDQFWDGYGSTPNVDQIKYGHDYEGNRQWREDVIAANNSKNFDELYEYDGLDRVIAAQRGNLSLGPPSIGSKNFEQEWSLDALGNWSEFRQNDDGTGGWELEQGRAQNNVNEITDITADTGANWLDPEYDAAGNMTAGPKPGDEITEQAYVYDAWSRLVKIQDDNGTDVAVFEYDGMGRRIVKTDVDQNATYHHYYNQDWQLLEVRKGTSTNPLEQYFWHPYYIDALALRFWDSDEDGNFTDADEILFYTHDANFNVTALVNDSGSVKERCQYQPYGTVAFLDASFANGSSTSNFGNETTYTGRTLDAEAGLFYYRHRYYDPALGRFGSRDPIGYEGSEGNLYEYVGSVPPRYSDPFGMLVTECVVAGATADAVVPDPTDLAAPIKVPAWAVLLVVGAGVDVAIDWLWKEPPKCRPCVPPVGTKACRVDKYPGSKPHKPFKGTHTHHFTMHQAPPTAKKPCICFWHEDSVTDGESCRPDEIPITPSEGGGLE